MNTESSRSPYNYARDGFLYLVRYFTLLISALAANFLIKSLFNTVLPDSAERYPFFSLTDLMIGFLPAILIAFPVFVWVNVYTNKLLGKGEMRHDTGVRRWLIYLTMVVVVVVILTQLIMLLTSYLGGAAAARFFVHTLVTLAIAAAILWYELWQLNFFTGDTKKKLSWSFKVFEWKIFVIVAAAVVLGFVAVGSPGARRAEKLDDIRIQRISEIRSAVDTFYGAPATQWSAGYGNLRLPKDLEELRQSQGVYLTREATIDPVTQKQFEYKLVSERGFNLCAEFALEQTASSDRRSFVIGRVEDYAHPAGYHCFEFEVTEGGPR